MDVLAIIKRIEIRLKEIGMSKADFYKESGISSASFSQWRKGIYEPSDRKLADAAACLGVPLTYLTGQYYREDVTAVGNGIRVFESTIPERVAEMLELVDFSECHIAYESPCCVIVVDNDSQATPQDISNVIRDNTWKYKKTEPTADDGFSENKKALIEFAKSVPEDKAARMLQVMQLILASDE